MIINIPNVGEVNFPDSMSEADINNAAKRLYDQSISNISAQPTETKPTESRSTVQELTRQLGLTGRAAYEAFTSPANVILEGVRGAYNLGAEALGSESRMPSFAQAQSQMLTSAGVPLPENILERSVQAGTQAMASTGAMAKMAPSVPALAQDLYRQIPTAAISGMAAQPTAEVVKDVTGSDLAATIAGLGMGMVTAAGSGKVMNAIETGQKPIYTMQQVKDRASQSYNTMHEAGVTIKPTSVNKMISNIKQELEEARMVPGTAQAKELNDRLIEMTRMVGQNDVSFTALDKMRSMLNDLKQSSDKDIKRLGSIAVSKVDDYIGNLATSDINAGKEGLGKAVQSLLSARKDWRNASRASILDDALNVAEARALDPKASESELIRRGFINIAADKNKMNQFNKTEQNIIKSVAKGGTLDPLLTIASRFSPLRSQLMAAGAGYGFTQAPVTTGLIAGGGLAADITQGILRSRAAKQAVKQIASGAEAPAPNLAYRGLLGTTLNLPSGFEEEKKKGLLTQ